MLIHFCDSVGSWQTKSNASISSCKNLPTLQKKKKTGQAYLKTEHRFNKKKSVRHESEVALILDAVRKNKPGKLDNCWIMFLRCCKRITGFK